MEPPGKCAEGTPLEESWQN